MKHTILFLLVILLPAQISAAQPRPDDFAFGIPLTIKNPAAIYMFQLPENVYPHLVQKKFADIRIFNSAGEPVPYSIEKNVVDEPEEKPVLSLPFFPVSRPGKEDENTFSMKINTNHTGAIINVKSDAGMPGISEELSYLVDFSALETMPRKLKFKWNSALDNFTLKTTLETSSNLTDWYPLRTDTTLASLKFSSHTLVKDEISLHGKFTKYIRINWPGEYRELQLLEIKAVFPEKKKRLPLQWQTIEPSDFDGEKMRLTYRIKGEFPLSRLTLEIPGENSLFRAQVSSRPDTGSMWRKRHVGLFYSMKLNSTLLNNKPVRMYQADDRFWQVELLTTATGLAQDLPRLKVGWVPRKISFLSQGEGPFLLAFGNFKVKAPDSVVDQLISVLDDTRQKSMIGEVVPGKLIQLGGAKTRPSTIPWQRWALWGTLVLGVILLGVMAFRLFRQMDGG